MERVMEAQLKDGSRMELHCIKFPHPERVPDWIKGLFGAPEGNGWEPRRPDGLRYLNVYGWERYYHDVFTGNSAEECTDYLYAASVEGVPAGRMWFGYSNRTGSGNFGNVLTLPEFRRRGIMSAMLREVTRDFDRSSARFVSCGAAPAAAPAYAAIGFQRILGPENHAMALVKPDAGSFSEILDHAYKNTQDAVIRPGRRGDRFDLDKLLAYAPEIAFRKLDYPNLFRDRVPDYLHAFQRFFPGRAALSVVEAASGFCAGFAYAEKCLPGVTAVTATLHPGFSGYLAPLIADAARELDKHLIVIPGTSDKGFRTALLEAGFRETRYRLFERE